MLLGRLLHSVDAALSNCLSPNVFVRTLGFDSSMEFSSEVILLEHELLTIPEDKQEHAQSEVKIYMESLIKNNYHY
jgi:hypothetical protein